MSDHCPFLNRSDARCSEYFRLSHLQHAFKFCFDQYHACPVYAQQLAERRERRAAAAASAGTVKHDDHSSDSSHDRPQQRPQVVVTVTVPARYAQSQRAA